jgi:hypothetical protein
VSPVAFVAFYTNCTQDFSPKSPVAIRTPKQFGKAPPLTDPLFSKEELKSARVVGVQGPFVDEKTGQQLRAFYTKYAPEMENEGKEEKILTIVQSGVAVSLLNSKLKAKYGADLDDFNEDF